VVIRLASWMINWRVSYHSTHVHAYACVQTILSICLLTVLQLVYPRHAVALLLKSPVQPKVKLKYKVYLPIQCMSLSTGGAMQL
jgi:hypothetical protein